MTFNSSSSSVATPACLGTEAPPVGFRFHPTDTELITDFLGPKIRRQDDDYSDPPIADVEVCKFEPWDLPVLSKIQSNDRVWYFFSPRQHKSKNTTRSNRKTNKGFWKPDGKPRQIRAKRSKQVIGSKRTLVFHLGNYKESERTKWVMHEYECLPSSGLSNQGDFVVLKLKDKSDEKDTKLDAYHQTVLNPEIETQELVEMADISSHGTCIQSDMMSSGSYNKNQDLWIIGAVDELVDANSVVSSPTIDSNMGSLSTSNYFQTLPQQSSQTPKSSLQSSFTHISPSSPASNISPTINSPLCHSYNNSAGEVASSQQSTQTPKSTLQTSNFQIFDSSPAINSPPSHYQNNDIDDIASSQQSTQTPKSTLQTSDFQIFDSLPAINSPLCHFQNNDFTEVTSFDGLLASDLESKCEEEPEGNTECSTELWSLLGPMLEKDYMVCFPPWMPTPSIESPSSQLFLPECDSAIRPSPRVFE